MMRAISYLLDEATEPPLGLLLELESNFACSKERNEILKCMDKVEVHLKKNVSKIFQS